MEGVRVIKIASGAMKAGDIPGVPIADEYVAEVQAQVDGINAMFRAAIAHGRGIPQSRFADVADGRVFSPQVAMESGLIDKVQTFDESMSQLAAIVQKVDANAQERTRAAAAKIKIAQLKKR